jgi:endonuclease/exonuclease/phosphatase family metal-dependent hydrolase
MNHSVNKETSSRRRFIKGLGATALLPLLPSVGAAAATAADKSGKHKILTCNIRVALPEDDAKGVGWANRKAICLNMIKQQQPDIICLQEVLQVQAEDCKNYFTGYSQIGFSGPEMDAHPEGYHGIAKNPILFSKSRYQLLAAGTYWLSETPLIAGSLSWGSARARHANWLRLKDLSTGREFRITNVHLDHIAEEARVQQARLVATECSQYQADFPQLLAGDFNTPGGSPVFESIRTGGFTDTWAAIHGNALPGFTAHAFEGLQYAKGKPDGKIDFIFCRGAVKPLAASIIKDAVHGKYPSDHFFVSAGVAI